MQQSHKTPMNKLLLTSLSLLFAIPLFSQFSFTNETNLLSSPSLLGTHPIAISDINGDGYDDIVVLDEFIIFFQEIEGNGFSKLEFPFDDGDNAWGMCVGDVDNDGYSDILYGGYFNGLSVVKHSQFIDIYTRTVHEEDEFLVFLQGVNFADLDNDGNLDIFACHDVGPSRIYLGDGVGGFTQNTTIIDTELNGGGENDSGNYGSLFTDINNDGLIDLFVAKCRQGVSDPADPRRINILFVNNGDGTFTEDAESWGINSGEQSWSADFGDIDNDGDMDLLLGQHTGEFVQVYINNGDETFTDITTDAGLSGSFNYQVIQSKFADFDNDGYLDIIIAGSSQFMFAHNNGDTTFTVLDDTQINSTMNSFALGDLNHDGYTDVYSTPGGYGGWGSEGSDSLYFNSGGDNNYITFDLKGVESNADGIGARITIYGPFGVQIREIRSGESYGIQNSLTAHFGLGSAASVDSAFINWPSGTIDQLNNLSANQFIDVTEGSSPVGINELSEEQLSFTVYPNPADQYIKIAFDELILNSTIDLEMISADGKTVKKLTAINTDQQINIESLESGNYIIKLIIDNKKVISKKITIK